MNIEVFFQFKKIGNRTSRLNQFNRFG